MVVRKRLIFWLIRAYIRKSGKVIFFSFLAGLIFFSIFFFSSNFFSDLIPVYKKSTIGVTGAYTKDNLPPFIVEKISRGLTAVGDSGEVKPSIASSWEILNNGKTYVFHLKKDQYFSDGRRITSDLINYNFSDVLVEKPNQSTIIFKLKDSYSPFLITVSRPLFQPGLTGAGDYKIDDIKLNGDFVQSLTLSLAKDRFDIAIYEFYPSIEALKYAYVLGEVNRAEGLDNLEFGKISFDSFSNSIITKKINHNKLVTLFYNNNDSILSDKKVRLALSYALPNNYSEGEKTFLPYSPDSIYFNKELEDKNQNYAHAKLLLSASNIASDSAELQKIKLSIKTLPKYKTLAKKIVESFSNIGLRISIEEVNTLPTDFQIYLGDFILSKDPDQYPLWHSDQPKNITKYKNLRIDKLLEDGRKTNDLNSRKSIYSEFQKFLTEDVPASFLYFPIEYDITRK
jgi:ABC-type transport system substrate-binding protein